MFKLRLLIAGAGAALVMGAGGALSVVAMHVANTDSDSHGDAVASAARTTCPHGPGGVHGACVSAIASSKSENEKPSTTEATEVEDETDVDNDVDNDVDTDTDKNGSDRNNEHSGKSATHRH